ncbi:MAG: hypothetical protein AB1779_00905 [Candidatus Thermoplasmatota archaeon]
MQGVAGQAMKILPREAIEKLIHVALKRQREMDIREIIGNNDFTGRSSMIVIKDIGSFAFVLKGTEMEYVGKGIPNTDPTVTLIMDRDTFEAIMANEMSPKEAWEKNKIEVISKESRWAYHCVIMLRIFTTMRKILGV